MKYLKDNRQHGALSAGPQSVLLEGITYQDIAAGRPDSDGIVGPSDRGILIGTASKGIIDRQFQHNAQVTYESFIHSSNDAFLCRSMDSFMLPIHSPLKPMNLSESICKKLSRSLLPQRNRLIANPLGRLSFMTRILKQVQIYLSNEIDDNLCSSTFLPLCYLISTIHPFPPNLQFDN